VKKQQNNTKQIQPTDQPTDTQKQDEQKTDVMRLFTVLDERINDSSWVRADRAKSSASVLLFITEHKSEREREGERKEEGSRRT